MSPRESLDGYRCTLCGARITYEVGVWACECDEGGVLLDEDLEAGAPLPERWKEDNA